MGLRQFLAAPIAANEYGSDVINAASTSTVPLAVLLEPLPAFTNPEF